MRDGWLKGCAGWERMEAEDRCEGFIDGGGRLKVGEGVRINRIGWGGKRVV